MAAPPRVFLIGFMGSGKSSAGPPLAALLGAPFFDLDALVETRAGMTVPEIFAAQGEATFRALESACLAELLATAGAGGFVAALGGGAWMDQINRDRIIQAAAATVFLDCPVEVLAQRCASSEQTAGSRNALRPLARDPAAFRRLYEQRLPVYRQAAITVSSATGTAEDIARAIAQSLAGRL